MTYKSRAQETRAPSAGLATRPIGGLGKLDVGVWNLTVLTVLRRPTSVEVVLAAPQGHSHYERLAAWPRDLDSPDSPVVGRVGPGPGFALERDVRLFRGVDARTREALTDWTADAALVYHQLTTRGLRPASTFLEAYKNADGQWVDLAPAGDPPEGAEAGVPTPAAADAPPPPGDPNLAGS